MTVTTPRVLTVEEVADILRVKPRVVYNLVRDGAIRSVRAGRQIRIPSEALDEYLGGDSVTER